jgi:phage/plasmid-like protein (TIGR03299 family)
MAHAVETMAYSGEVPWHGLGTKVIDDLTPEQMMEKAGIDWTVKKRPLTYSSSKHKVFEVPGKQALIRETDGKLLDVVGTDWNPVQNAEAMGFFHDFVMEGDMKMDTAGSLREGQMVWALAKVDNDFTLFDGDKVESYLLFSNPHQYGKSIDIRFTPIRVVCNNTLTMSLSGNATNGVKVGHRKEFDASLVKQTLGLAEQRMDEYKNIANALGEKQYSEDKVKEYFGHILGTSKVTEDKLSRTARRAFEILETQPGAEYRKGSWWNALNAVTYITDHELGRNSDNRVSSAWFGGNRTRKLKAVEKAVEYAHSA